MPIAADVVDTVVQNGYNVLNRPFPIVHMGEEDPLEEVRSHARVGNGLRNVPVAVLVDV